MCVKPYFYEYGRERCNESRRARAVDLDRVAVDLDRVAVDPAAVDLDQEEERASMAELFFWPSRLGFTLAAPAAGSADGNRSRPREWIVFPRLEHALAGRRFLPGRLAAAMPALGRPDRLAAHLSMLAVPPGSAMAAQMSDTIQLCSSAFSSESESESGSTIWTILSNMDPYF